MWKRVRAQSQSKEPWRSSQSRLQGPRVRILSLIPSLITVPLFLEFSLPFLISSPPPHWLGWARVLIRWSQSPQRGDQKRGKDSQRRLSSLLLSPAIVAHKGESTELFHVCWYVGMGVFRAVLTPWKNGKGERGVPRRRMHAWGYTGRAPDQDFGGFGREGIFFSFLFLHFSSSFFHYFFFSLK